ncbi:MAG: LysR substrate-binding domain-containing protein [Deferribacterales bacterium]
MNISIRQIEVFFYTAKLGNVSLAAEKLCITQAAASMALKEFENQLGEKLFERMGKKLVLNESGRAILASATELIGRASEMSGFFTDRSRLYGDLIIGASSSIGNYVLPEYIAEFIDTNRMASIQLKVGNTEDVINRVLRFDVDVGIIEGLCYEPMIDVIPWLDDELAVFTSSGHPLAQAEKVSKKDLESCDWILREEGSGTRRIFENQMTALSMNINVMLVLGHTEAIKNTVAKGKGVSCLSRYVLADLAQLGKIKLLDTPFLNLKRKFYVLIHQEKFKTRILREFLSGLGLGQTDI